MLLVQASLRAAEPTEAEIKALIEQLASTNERPRAYPEVHEGPEAKYPRNYDEAAQKKVWATYRELKKIGPEAFPYLHAHLKDERYSLTEDTGSVFSNINVGFLCDWILKEQISPFENKVVGEGYSAPRHPGHPNSETGPRGPRPARPNYYSLIQSDAQWFKNHQHSSLHSIQIEALQWMIAEEEKDPKTYDAEERTELKRILAKLVKTKTPLVSRRSFIAK